MSNKIVHLMGVPFTGLGLYNGFRGNRFLRNRIKIFKQFVVPSLQAQSNQNFILWCAWRYEERNNKQVIELKQYLDDIGIPNVFTYSGIWFWDDKYEPEVARTRMINAIHGAMGDLLNVIGDADEILLTIQPSDDCYWMGMVDEVQAYFDRYPGMQAVGYSKGYVMDYKNLELAHWNPETNPPFYTIKFHKDTFTDPLKHYLYAAHESHEYVGDKLKYEQLDHRGFIVGCHMDNISTVFKHPYTGEKLGYVSKLAVLDVFGLYGVDNLHIRVSIRKWIMKKLPHGWQRKLRYVLGERGFAKIYSWLRS